MEYIFQGILYCEVNSEKPRYTLCTLKFSENANKDYEILLKTASS